MLEEVVWKDDEFLEHECLGFSPISALYAIRHMFESNHTQHTWFACWVAPALWTRRLFSRPLQALRFLVESLYEPAWALGRTGRQLTWGTTLRCVKSPAQSQILIITMPIGNTYKLNHNSQCHFQTSLLLQSSFSQQPMSWTCISMNPQKQSRIFTATTIYFYVFFKGSIQYLQP